MSYLHSNEVREMPGEKFDSATQRYLMIEIAHVANHQGIINQSQTDIATESLLSRVTVANEFKKLESKGLITREKHGQYKINIFLAKQTPAQTKKEEETEEPDEFESWWEDNYIPAEDGNAAVLTLMDDDIPEAVKKYRDEGLIKLEPGFVVFQGVPHLVYKKVTP